MTRPTELTPTEYTALLFMLNYSNWYYDQKGNHRPPTGPRLAKTLGYEGSAYAYVLVNRLIKKGYLDADLKATYKCKNITKSFGEHSVRGMN